MDDSDSTAINPSSSLMAAVGGGSAAAGSNKNLLAGRMGSSAILGEHHQPETPRGSGIPQPSPANAASARPTDPRFKLLEINPAGTIDPSPALSSSMLVIPLGGRKL